MNYKIGDRVMGVDKASFSFGRDFTVIEQKGELVKVKADIKGPHSNENGIEHYETYKLRYLTKLDKALK